MRKMEKKVVLVTGAGSGIGRAAALAFAREGAKVVAADIQPQAAAETIRLIKSDRGEAIWVQADVSQAGEVSGLIDKAVEKYGRLDCAFNNAGIEGNSAATADCDEENWNRVIAVNLTGVWLCMKYEIRQMLKQGGGAIVNCASVAGIVGFPGLPAYCASKGGIIQLTKAAALEYAKNRIRVNAVCPGVVHTAMIDRITGGKSEAEAQFAGMEPIGRMGTPEEIAAGVVWLCADDASFVTGHPMVIDGGFVAQ
jgi:NAD(P)-dependent dehydrogenase (short-subunit alcohol dehydrogenase family)